MKIQTNNHSARFAPTVNYFRVFIGPSQRPNGKMPLSAHEEAGRLLKEVYAATVHRRPIRRPLEAARNILDEWALQEYPDHDNPPTEEFNNLYYNTPPQSSPRRLSQEYRNRYAAGLQRVQEIIVAHYPASAPRRELLAVINRAVELLKAWK